MESFMSTFRTAIITIAFIFSISAFAGYTQPAEVEVVVNPDGSFYAGGDMWTARSAQNDVSSIGCGVRKYIDANNNWGFCQANDENDQYVSCWTEDQAMLDAISVLNDSSYIGFAGDSDGECVRISASSQSFYVPLTTTKGKK